MNKLEIRNAINNLIQFMSEFGKFKNEGLNLNIFEECREKFILLLHPIAPHITEEIWEKIKRRNFVSLESWPSFDEKLLTKESAYKWDLINNIIDDINKIKLAMKKETLDKICIIIADKWKSRFYNKLLSLIEVTKNQAEIMKTLMQDADIKVHGKFVSRIVSKILKNVGKYSKFFFTSKDEFEFFYKIKSILENKFAVKVEVNFEKDSNEQKAAQALPGKPAIVIY
jgi:leucyl-tRNA synthetase